MLQLRNDLALRAAVGRVRAGEPANAVPDGAARGPKGAGSPSNALFERFVSAHCGAAEAAGVGLATPHTPTGTR